MDGAQVFDSDRYQTTRDLEFSFSLPDTQDYSDLTDPVEIRIYGYSGQWGGHKTSLSLEDAFWDAFKEIVEAQGTTISHLTAAVDSQRHEGHQTNLSSAIRLFVLEHYRSRMRPPTEIDPR